MSQNQAYTYIIDTAANLPTNATEGVIAYAKDDNTVYAYDGSTWNAVGGSSYTNLDFLENNYHPDRAPASYGTGGVGDEFEGGATLSFSWQNQESSTATAQLDGLTLFHPADSSGVACYYFTGPDGSSTDWVYSTVVEVDANAAFNQFGIGILSAGTEASPTTLHMLIYYYNGGLKIGARSMTSYTSAQTAIGADINITENHRVYLQLRYDSSAKALDYYTSLGGKVWRYATAAGTTTTLGAHPTTSFFMLISSLNATVGNTAHVDWIRVRTDATGIAAPFPCGA